MFKTNRNKAYKNHSKGNEQRVTNEWYICQPMLKISTY